MLGRSRTAAKTSAEVGGGNLSWLTRILQRSQDVDGRVTGIADLHQDGIAEPDDADPPR